MVRFFTTQHLTDEDRAVLGEYALKPEAFEIASGNIARIGIDEDRVKRFLQTAEVRRVAMFHDPEFGPPPPSLTCQGAQAWKYQIEDKLTHHPRNGDGALILIADGGFEDSYVKGVIPAARIDRGIATPFKPPAGKRPHGNMCAIDALFGAPNATLADLTVRNGARALSSDLFYAALMLLGLQTEPVMTRYRAWVVSISLQVVPPPVVLSLPAGVQLTLNPLHPLSIAVYLLSRAGFDMLVAGGNDGCLANGYITGLAAHSEVVTVGAVDRKDVVEPRSSRGAPMSKKPDILSYTNFMLSKSYSKSIHDMGTSAATALAAGLVASYRTAVKGRDRANMPPARLRAHLKATARQPNGSIGQHDTTHGWGIW